MILLGEKRPLFKVWRYGLSGGFADLQGSCAEGISKRFDKIGERFGMMDALICNVGSSI